MSALFRAEIRSLQRLVEWQKRQAEFEAMAPKKAKERMKKERAEISRQNMAARKAMLLKIVNMQLNPISPNRCSDLTGIDHEVCSRFLREMSDAREIGARVLSSGRLVYFPVQQ